MSMLAGEATGEDSMMENLNNVLHSIFGLFENFVEMGATWGEPWSWLFPTFIAFFIVLAFFSGFRYVFEQTQEKIRPWFFFALLIVGILAFAAIQSSDEEPVPEGLPETEES